MAIIRERVAIECDSGGAGASVGSAYTNRSTPDGVIDAIHLEYLPVLAFTSGSDEPTIGDTISGNTSGATGVVVDYEVTSGSWAGGDAAGNIWISDQSGTFQSETLDNDTTGQTNFATIGADSTAVASTTDITVAEAGNNDGPVIPILVVANNNTDGWYSPRKAVHDPTDGSALTGPVDYISVADTLLVSVAGANSKDHVRVTIVWDDMFALREF